MKKIITIMIALLVGINVICFSSLKQGVNAEEKIIKNDCRAYILMDKDSGKVLNEYNSKETMPVASIVKLMTILLTLEELDKGNLKTSDLISVSENASHMGGSQIFLDPNVEYEVGNLLKSVIVCSANDSSVALAEHIAGSEELFVRRMNEKARELKLENTNYENATGLPSPNQYSCALDVGKVLNEVLDYELYHEYSKVWLEDFVHPSGRTTEMTNTNKLIRFYEGCIGGKTGSTNEAKYCLASGAKRGNLTLIAVVLGSENSTERFDNVRTLLNYGFSSYENKVLFNQDNLNGMRILMQGQNKSIGLIAEREINIVTKKGEEVRVDFKFNLPDSLKEVNENEVVGFVDVIVNGEKFASVNLLSNSTINKPTLKDYIDRIQEDFV